MVICMVEISKEDLAKLSQVPLPPEIDNMIKATRTQFFSEIGGCFENSLKGLELVIKSLIVSLAQQEEAKKGHVTPNKVQTPNRATRRKAIKKAKKQK